MTEERTMGKTGLKRENDAVIRYQYHDSGFLPFLSD